MTVRVVEVPQTQTTPWTQPVPGAWHGPVSLVVVAPGDRQRLALFGTATAVFVAVHPGNPCVAAFGTLALAVAVVALGSGELDRAVPSAAPGVPVPAPA